MSIAEIVRVCLLADVLVAAILPGQVLPPAQIMSASTQKASTAADHQHDFDFEFGSWKAHLRRRLLPLSGSNEWVEYDGRSVVRRVWSGAANLGEFSVDGKAGHIEGMSLRLYSPDAHKWSIYWANRQDGDLWVPPMVGSFANGRGEFYDHETFQDKPI